MQLSIGFRLFGIDIIDGVGVDRDKVKIVECALQPASFVFQTDGIGGIGLRMAQDDDMQFVHQADGMLNQAHMPAVQGFEMSDEIADTLGHNYSAGRDMPVSFLYKDTA